MAGESATAAPEDQPGLNLAATLILISLFFLPLMQIDIAPTRPLAKEIHLDTLQVYNLEVYLNRDRQGVWNHSRMAMITDQTADPDIESPASITN